MKSDGDLLRQFAHNHDQACFAELVQRHIKFVYAVCHRRVPAPSAAEDATQEVFVALARKARSVAEVPSVVGWLHRSACFQTRYLLRSHSNRVARETEAHHLGTTAVTSRPELEEIGPVLDEVLCELPDTDREAIIDRYFFEHSYASIGAKLRLTDNAARMRVERALQRLRGLLERRGVTSTAAALAAALPTYATAQEPAGLAAAIVKASTLAAASGAGAGIIFMGTTKIIVGVVVAASVAGFVWEKNRSGAFEDQLASAHSELSATTQRLQGLEAELRDLQQAHKEIEAKLASSGSGKASPQHAKAAEPPPPPVPGVIPEAPKGWMKNGSANDLYQVGVDQNNSWGGMPSAYVKSTGEANGKFGGMMQTISAEAFRGQRVQLNGWMKTQDAIDGGNLWMRVDGQGSGNVLQFDNMNGRAPKGTTDWQEYSVVLDVPQESAALAYGFFVAGKGQVWVNGLTITPVTSDVPSTTMTKPPAALPKTPVNLGFVPVTTSR